MIIQSIQSQMHCEKLERNEKTGWTQYSNSSNNVEDQCRCITFRFFIVMYDDGKTNIFWQETDEREDDDG